MDQKVNFGRTIAYGDSYLEYRFCRSKVFRLDAILDDDAGTVRSQSGRGVGFCYMIGRGTNSCLCGQVTGLLLCSS